MEEFKKLYQNPLVNIAFTFLEPFPIGFLVSLISAGVLRRRAGPGFGASRELAGPLSTSVTSRALSQTTRRGASS